MTDIGELRNSFDTHTPIESSQLPADPLVLFAHWFTAARNCKHIKEPNAFVLSTINRKGRLRSRTVLLKSYDQEGYVFFTNYGSQKAKDIAENENVAMCFPWYVLERQLMIEGSAEKISTAKSLQYFISRPRGSQIGAWASAQSSIINSRAVLMDKVKQLTQHYLDKDVPLPDFWGGYRIIPSRFEFWQGQPNRLHDRIEYLPDSENPGNWQKQRLSP